MSRKMALMAAMMVIAIVIGYPMMVYACNIGGNGVVTMAYTTQTVWTPFKARGGTWRGVFKGPLMWSIEVSTEYNSTVTSIVESNPETSQLLSQGYDVVWIKPIIKAYVSGNGDVVLRAARAAVALTNSTAIYVYLVDVESGAVTLLAYLRAPSNVLGFKCLRG
ncbi:MAG: hypothetical protein QXT74_03595 [Candidatus Nezhaarchaeales archaeon]